MLKEIKTFEAEVKEFDEKDLTVTHFISTEKKDRGGDIMRANGMVINGKPVVLFSHGSGPMGQEAIAKPLWIKEGQFKNRPGIMAKTQFFPDDLGKRLWQKTTTGYMPNWSIGYQVLEKTDIKDGEGWGRDITKWELLEYSPVGVPMNPDARTIESGKSEEGIMFKIMPEAQKEAAILADSIEVKYDEWEELFDMEMKPYPNEHACRVNDPGKYKRIRRQNDKFGKGIHVIWGVLGDDTTEVQAIRFSMSKFTADEAKAWCKEHEYKCKPFEAATGKELTEAHNAIAALDLKLDQMWEKIEALKASPPVIPDPGDKGPEGDRQTKPGDQKVVIYADAPQTVQINPEELKTYVKEIVRSTLKEEMRKLTGKVD